MTLYTQPQNDVFASAAPSDEIQDFSAWTRGLGIAFDETNGYPEMKGFNGLLNALSNYIKYLEQNGFSEWRPAMEYPQGAGVRVGMIWYRAKERNTGKAPATSQNEWEVFLNTSALSYTEPLYIENNVVKIRSATTALAGVGRFANAQEVQSKANVTAAVTPKNVADMFIGGVTPNNSLTLPSGHILKWGVVDYSSSPGEIPVNVTFPSAFPNNVLNIQITRKSIDGNESDGVVNLVSQTNSGFRAHFNTWGQGVSGLRGFTWFAIGY